MFQNTVSFFILCFFFKADSKVHVSAQRAAASSASMATVLQSFSAAAEEPDVNAVQTLEQSPKMSLVSSETKVLLSS